MATHPLSEEVKKELETLSLDSIKLDSREAADWKIFNSSENKKPLAWMIKFWEKSNIDNQPYPTYTFSLPAHWIVGEGYPIVFDTNADGNKVAEMRGIVSLKEIKNCSREIDEDEKLIKLKNIKLGDLDGTKTVVETMMDGGDDNIWHVYSYCLANKQFAFFMSFQSVETDKKSEQTFDQVVSTFKFYIPTLPQSENKSTGNAPNK